MGNKQEEFGSEFPDLIFECLTCIILQRQMYNVVAHSIREPISYSALATTYGSTGSATRSTGNADTSGTTSLIPLRRILSVKHE